MIQILVCDKVYVTPAMRRKKLLYRIYFILSICLIFSLFFYYIYAEYDRNKSEQVSQEILQGISIDRIDKGPKELDYEQREEIDDTTIKVEDNVIVVVLNDETEEEVDMDELLVAAKRQIEEVKENNEEEVDVPPQIYTASDGKQYYTVAVVSVPKLGISYPVLTNENTDISIDKLLKISVCKYHGPNPNRVGNFCIVGHNYKNSKFFSKLDTLEVMDIIQLQDMSGKVCEYAVYDKYVVEPTDTRCTSQLTDGKKEITLITCYNNGKQRTVIKAVEVK